MIPPLPLLLFKGAEEPPQPRSLEPGQKRHPRVVDSVSYLRARVLRSLGIGLLQLRPLRNQSAAAAAAAPPTPTVGGASAFSPPRARDPPTAARTRTRPRSHCGEGGGERSGCWWRWLVTCIIRGAACEAAQQGRAQRRRMEVAGWGSAGRGVGFVLNEAHKRPLVCPSRCCRRGLILAQINSLYCTDTPIKQWASEEGVGRM